MGNGSIHWLRGPPPGLATILDGIPDRILQWSPEVDEVDLIIANSTEVGFEALRRKPEPL